MAFHCKKRMYIWKNGVGMFFACYIIIQRLLLSVHKGRQGTR